MRVAIHAARATIVMCLVVGCRLRVIKAPGAEAPLDLDLVPQVYASRGAVNAAALSNDGSLAAVGTQEGPVLVLDVDTSKILRLSDAHHAEVAGLVFRKGGRELVSVAHDGRLCVHDLTRNSVPRCRYRDTRDFRSAAFSRDGKFVVSGRTADPRRAIERTRFDVVEVDSGRVVGSGRGVKTTAFHVAISADGTRVAVRGGNDWQSYVKGVRGAPRTKRLRKLGDSLVTALDADGSRLITATDGALTVYDIRRGQPVLTIPDTELKFYTRTLAISPDGRHVLAAPTTGLRVYDLDTGSLVPQPQALRAGATSLTFSADGRRVLAGDYDGLFSLFDFSDEGVLSHRPLVLHRSRLSAGHFSADGTGAYLGGDEGVFELDLRFGGIRALHRLDLGVTALSPDGQTLGTWQDAQSRRGLLVGQSPGSPFFHHPTTAKLDALIIEFDHLGRRFVDAKGRVYDRQPGLAPTLRLDSKRIALEAVALSRDGSWLITAEKNSEGLPRTFEESAHVVEITEVESGQRLASFHHPKLASAIVLSPDGTLLATGETRESVPSNNAEAMRLGYTVRVWDVVSGRELHTLDGPADGAGACAFTSDKRLLLVGGANAISYRAGLAERGSQLYVYDLDSGELLRSMAGHFDTIRSLSISPDDRIALTTSDDGTARLWNIATGESATIIIADGEWLVYTDDGYFAASRRGHTLVSAVEDRRAFAIDQLATRNNRPDLIMTRLGFGRPEVVAHFEARYHRRLRKLGLSEDRLAASFQDAPLARIDEIEVEGAEATLRFTVEDAATPLLRYNVYVDDVPLHGAGKAIEGHRHGLSERVELLEGHNRIEVSVLNEAGVESLRDFRVVEGPPRPPGDLYFLGFGVSKYRNPDLDLDFAHRDALDLGATLAGPVGGFRQVHVCTYVDEQVTVDTIEAARTFLASARVTDTVVLFVAGHGTHGRDGTATYYYLTHEADIDHLAETAINFERIEALLQGIESRSKLFLLDTCESGERKFDGPILASLAGERGVAARTARALVYDPGTEQLPAPAQWLHHIDRERYIYNDLARRTGAIVLSSSRGDERSYEADELHNGVFTEALLEALQGGAADSNGDGLTDMIELRTYTERRVAELTNDLQHPTVDRDNRRISIELPLFQPLPAPINACRKSEAAP